MLFAALIALLLAAIVLYNRLVTAQKTVEAAWSDIDVQLKRRHDLIPKLVDTVKAYTAYEKTTLTQVTELRSLGARLDTVSERGPVEQKLTQALRNMFLLAEDYPNLKASAQFLELQHNISAVEEQIQYARRFYNGAVKRLNVRVDSFPSMLVANAFSFTHGTFFSMDPA